MDCIHRSGSVNFLQTMLLLTVNHYIFNIGFSLANDLQPLNGLKKVNDLCTAWVVPCLGLLIDFWGVLRNIVAMCQLVK